jgi:hypothetical protein
MQASRTSTSTAPGPLIVVLGPSGSGKDTLMSYARKELAARDDVLFVRRTITRPADAGSEDHVPMTDVEFDAAIDRGEFSLTWAANGLRYGLPRAIEAHLGEGKPAIVNGSGWTDPFWHSGCNREAGRVLRRLKPGWPAPLHWKPASRRIWSSTIPGRWSTPGGLWSAI